MSIRQSPPKQSPAQRGPKVVTDHAGKCSVGHNVGTRKTVNDPDDPDNDFDDGSGTAPGANGPAETASG